MGFFDQKWIVDYDCSNGLFSNVESSIIVDASSEYDAKSKAKKILSSSYKYVRIVGAKQQYYYEQQRRQEEQRRRQEEQQKRQEEREKYLNSLSPTQRQLFLQNEKKQAARNTKITLISLGVIALCLIVGVLLSIFIPIIKNNIEVTKLNNYIVKYGGVSAVAFGRLSVDGIKYEKSWTASGKDFVFSIENNLLFSKSHYSVSLSSKSGNVELIATISFIYGDFDDTATYYGRIRINGESVCTLRFDGISCKKPCPNISSPSNIVIAGYNDGWNDYNKVNKYKSDLWVLIDSAVSLTQSTMNEWDKSLNLW